MHAHVHTYVHTDTKTQAYTQHGQRRDLLGRSYFNRCGKEIREYEGEYDQNILLAHVKLLKSK